MNWPWSYVTPLPPPIPSPSSPSSTTPSPPYHPPPHSIIFQSLALSPKSSSSVLVQRNVNSPFYIYQKLLSKHSISFSSNITVVAAVQQKCQNRPPPPTPTPNKVTFYNSFSYWTQKRDQGENRDNTLSLVPCLLTPHPHLKTHHSANFRLFRVSHIENSYVSTSTSSNHPQKQI